MMPVSANALGIVFGCLTIKLYSACVVVAIVSIKLIVCCVCVIM